MNNPQAMKKLLNMKKLLMIVGMMLAAGAGIQSRRAEAQPGSTEQVVALVPVPGPSEKKPDVLKGKFGLANGSWFQGEHSQRRMTVVVDDKVTHLLYFGLEKRDDRIREALKLEGAVVMVKGNLMSPEKAAKIYDVDSGKDRRILEVHDIGFAENIDPDRAIRVPVVLRVKWLRSGAAKSIAMEEVEILAVLKNTSGQIFDKTLLVGRANVEEGAALPQQACTIYLEADEDARKNRFWTLLNRNLDQKGVSHLAEEGENSKPTK